MDNPYGEFYSQGPFLKVTGKTQAAGRKRMKRKRRSKDSGRRKRGREAAVKQGGRSRRWSMAS